MSDAELQTTAAVRELLQLVGGLDDSFLRGPRAVSDTQSVLEGYKWMFALLAVGLDAYVHADTARPRFADIVGPTRKWGGDNSDAFYQYAPVDPDRTYRVSVQPGDAVYLSLTVYGGPDDGRYSDRIVGSLNLCQMSPALDGSFEIVLSARELPGNWIRLDPDAVCMITRDYLADPAGGCRAVWSVTADDAPPTVRVDDADLARRFRAAATWIRDQTNIAPLPSGDPNLFADPFPVPERTIGWAAGDAAYASGTFDLADDEALVVEGASPPCVFWNLCLWNPFMHTFNYDYERVTINGAQVVATRAPAPSPDPASDPSSDPASEWTVVIAAQDPGHPNWVSTQGHRSGRIWIRWFLPEAIPIPLRTRVVPTAEVEPDW